MLREQRLKRKTKIRSKISGTKKRPRLSVYKSNKYIYAQLVNDESGETLAAVSDDKTKADNVGSEIAKKAKSKKIKEVVFDRGGFKYHGNVKELADAARKGGLKF